MTIKRISNIEAYDMSNERLIKAMHKCTSLGFVPFMELGGNND